MSVLVFWFRQHNYCPTSREAGKCGDACVTGQSSCSVWQFSEQINTIKNKRYHKKDEAINSQEISELLDDPKAGELVFGFTTGTRVLCTMGR